MASVAQVSQGRTVYGNGSFAPTRGRVSAQGAQGYLRRELGKQQPNRGLYGGVSTFGTDGRSDTRSGVTTNLLNNKWAGQEGIGGRPTVDKNGKPTRPPVGNDGGGGQPVDPNRTGAGTPNTPSVIINDAGTLELPYSPAWSQEVLGGLQDTNDALFSLQQQQQQQALQHAANKKNAADQYTVTQRDTLNDNAGRGVAFSSGYGVAVGQDSNNYNNQVNQLELANSQANAGFDFDRTTIINAFKDKLRQASLDYADSLAEGAGTLGYGDNRLGSGGSGGSNSGGSSAGRTKKSKPKSKPVKPKPGTKPGR